MQCLAQVFKISKLFLKKKLKYSNYNSNLEWRILRRKFAMKKYVLSILYLLIVKKFNKYILISEITLHSTIMFFINTWIFNSEPELRWTAKFDAIMWLIQQIIKYLQF